MKVDNVKAKIEAEKKYKTGKIREQNYELIINAAQCIFAQHGYKGASMMAIAVEAGLPKANVHYYFKNKSYLYSAVLERIIDERNSSFDHISENDDPAAVLEPYIYDKVRLACVKPQPSKLFASEIIAGAPYLNDHIRTHMREWLQHKVSVMQSWMDQGKMRKLDAENLIFMIWATTQHYADFETQVLMITNRNEYDSNDIDRIAGFVTDMIFAGCDLKASWQKDNSCISAL